MLSVTISSVPQIMNVALCSCHDYDYRWIITNLGEQCSPFIIPYPLDNPVLGLPKQLCACLHVHSSQGEIRGHCYLSILAALKEECLLPFLDLLCSEGSNKSRL